MLRLAANKTSVGVPAGVVALAQIPGAALRILPGLKHSVLVEAPEAIAAMLLEFLLA